MSNQNLKDKIAIVTGAGSGIGTGISKFFMIEERRLPYVIYLENLLKKLLKIYQMIIFSILLMSLKKVILKNLGTKL